MSSDNPFEEGERILGICNACRYCEGYCAVFPAMERRLSFTQADVNYLANLCHNCSECLYACQYAPPHEFAVNVPRTLAQVRKRSYREYAWPRGAARAFERNGLLTALLLAVVLACFVGGTALALGGATLFTPVADGGFYKILPHAVLAYTFSAVGLFVVIAMVIACRRFWHDANAGAANPVSALGRGLKDALTLKNLHGGGAGCTHPNRERAGWWRWSHHLTLWGFSACFAATCVGTIYHYFLAWEAPYGYLSLPVILGTLGGVALLLGLTGLYVLKQARDPDALDDTQHGMDVAFIGLLWLTSLTGLLLLALRTTALMGIVLVIHLGVVMALFLLLPYGKFMHGVYRTAALVKNALEKNA